MLMEHQIYRIREFLNEKKWDPQPLLTSQKGDVKVKKIYFIALLAIFLNCSHHSSPVSVNTATGAVDVKVFIGPVGMLSKAQTSISGISLAKEYLQLSAVGEPTRLDSFTFSGHSQIELEKIFSDLRVKTWMLKAWTIDALSNVIHSDSSAFTVVENDTVVDSLYLSAKYSEMSAKIYPVSDSAKKCQITVNGALVIDTAFGKNSGIDTLRVMYDYLLASLTPGSSNTVSIKIYGDWIDQDTLLWSGSSTFNVISGVDASIVIPLTWVGPKYGGGDLILVFGRIGTVTVNGVVQPRPNS
jgi:hypothetical protein